MKRIFIVLLSTAILLGCNGNVSKTKIIIINDTGVRWDSIGLYAYTQWHSLTPQNNSDTIVKSVELPDDLQEGANHIVFYSNNLKHETNTFNYYESNADVKEEQLLRIDKDFKVVTK
jgi:hypothetical protein